MTGVQEGKSNHFKRSTLLFLAVTLHNIPEGLAVGLSFSLAVQGNQSFNLTSALVLAIGIGLQNLPEGDTISLPLRKEGVSASKAFIFGALSGVVEPISRLSWIHYWVYALVFSFCSRSYDLCRCRRVNTRSSTR